MTWTKPDFQELTLGMEVTGYVNTDERAGAVQAAEDSTKESARSEGKSHPNSSLVG